MGDKSKNKPDPMMEKSGNRIFSHMGKWVRVTLCDEGIVWGMLVGYSKTRSLYLGNPAIYRSSEILSKVEGLKHNSDNSSVIDTVFEVKYGTWAKIETNRTDQLRSKETAADEKPLSDADYGSSNVVYNDEIVKEKPLNNNDGNVKLMDNSNDNNNKRIANDYLNHNDEIKNQGNEKLINNGNDKKPVNDGSNDNDEKPMNNSNDDKKQINIDDNDNNIDEKPINDDDDDKKQINNDDDIKK